MADQLFGHHPTLRAREKQALLSEGLHVQKTVSLLLAGRLILVTSIGDRLLERTERYAIAANLGLSHKAAQQATFNPLHYYRRIHHRYVRWSVPDIPLVELNAGDEMRLPSDHVEGVTQQVGTLREASEVLAR
jgi:hypothetical protein